MKKISLLFMLAALTMNFAVAQHVISWSGVLKTAADEPLASVSVMAKVGVYSGGFIPILLYEEEHAGITNAYGFLTLDIGSGAVNAGVFAELNWTQKLKIKVQVNSGSGYEVVSYDDMNAVPYAKGSEVAQEIKKGNSRIYVDGTFGNLVFSVDGISKMNVTNEGTIFSEALQGTDTAGLMVTEDGEIIRMPSTPKFLTIAGSSFKPTSSAVQHDYTLLNGTQVSSSGPAHLMAPFHLPDGAKITEITYYYKDESVANSLQMGIMALDESSTTFFVVPETGLISTTSSTIQNIALTTPMVIDNIQGYNVVFYAHNWADLAIDFAKITYILP